MHAPTIAHLGEATVSNVFHVFSCQGMKTTSVLDERSTSVNQHELNVLVLLYQASAGCSGSGTCRKSIMTQKNASGIPKSDLHCVN